MQFEARVDRRALFINLAAMGLLAIVFLVLMVFLIPRVFNTPVDVRDSTSILASNPELSAARRYEFSVPAAGAAPVSDNPELGAARRYGISAAPVSDNPELSAARRYGISAAPVSDNPELGAARRYAPYVPRISEAQDKACYDGMGDSIFCERNR